MWRISGGLVAIALLSLPLSASLQTMPWELTVTKGEPVTIGVETKLENPVYSWVLAKDEQILKTQAGRFFETVIPDEGLVNLSLAVRSGDTSEETYAFLLRSESKIEIDPTESSFVRAVLRSSPPAIGLERRVVLPADGGTLLLHMDESTGSIAEYRIDVNTAVDSDGDTVPDNDADNRVHPSFFDGSVFPLNIVPAPSERERGMQLRVLGANGEMSEARIIVVFDSSMPLIPILTTLPPKDPVERVLRLPAEGGIVRFDASESQGGASRFSLDLNLQEDSDGDGTLTNDNDVQATAFERSGQEITILLQPRSGESWRDVALTVMDRAGRSETLMQKIAFGNGVIPSAPPGDPRIVANVPFLTVGNEFSLTVENAPLGTSSYAWDLQSDGAPDTETTVPTLLLKPDAPGVLPVRVSLRDPFGAILSNVQKEFTVQPAGTEAPSSPTATGSLRIDVVSEDLSVTFSPVGENTRDPTVLPMWEFGDGTKSYLLTPVHLYSQAGAYEVQLTLTDQIGGRIISSAKESITVYGGTGPSEPVNAGGGFFRGALRTAGFILTVVLFVLVLLLILTGATLGFLSVKGRSENKSLKEMLQIYKQSIFGKGEEGTPERVPKIIEASAAPKKPSDEPLPMKLVVPDVADGKKPSPAPELPKPAPQPQAAQPVPPPPVRKPEQPLPPPPEVKKPIPQVSKEATPQGEAAQLPPWLTPSSKEKISVPPVTTPGSKIAPPPVQSPKPNGVANPVPPIPKAPPPPPSAPRPAPANEIPKPVSVPPVIPPPPSPIAPAPQEPAPQDAKKTEPPATQNGVMPSWLKQGMEKAEEKKPEALPVPKEAPPKELPKVTPPMLLTSPPSPVPEEPIAIIRAELPEDEGKHEEPPMPIPPLEKKP